MERHSRLSGEDDDENNDSGEEYDIIRLPDSEMFGSSAGAGENRGSARDTHDDDDDESDESDDDDDEDDED